MQEMQYRLDCGCKSTMLQPNFVKHEIVCVKKNINKGDFAR